MQTLIPNAADLFRSKQPYAYWLGNIPSIGNKTIHYLLDVFEYPEVIYQTSEQELSAHLTKKQLANLLASRETWDIQKNYQLLCQKRISFLPCYHPAFPTKLKNIPDPPYCIYFVGKLPSINEPLIAIIGARSCSEYGRKTAEYFSKAFAEANIGIVSGLARGIDGYSQTVALSNGGRTYAILGCGVDICYPAENFPIYQKIPASGALISEYPPGTQPRSNLFPQRNRIISGLCDALLVIEAKEKSGTLITVDMALEQGREVYAVPGRICDALSFGCNRLIKQGASIATSPQDIVSDLYVEAMHCEESSLLQKTGYVLSEKEQTLLHLLDYQPVSLDHIYQQITKNPTCGNITIPNLMHMLTQLTLKGLIRQQAGSYYLAL